MDDIKNKDQPNEPSNDYQKILDEYAASIKPEDVEPQPEQKEITQSITASLKEVEPQETTKPEITSPPQQSLKDINAPQLESPIHPSLAANLETEDDYQKSFNQPEKINPVDLIKNEFTPSSSMETPEVTKTPEEIKAEINKILSDDTPTSQPEYVSSPKTGSNFFKILFIISLLIFFGVAGVLAYTLLNDDSATNTDTSQSLIPTETPNSGVVCELNGQTYQLGESFASADGCNTCTCESVDVIACTEKACAGVTTIPATKSATTSTIPKDWKTYTDPTYKFSIKYPSNWKINKQTNYVAFETEEYYAAIKSATTPGGLPYFCGQYNIGCYKNLANFVTIYGETTKFDSIYNFLSNDPRFENTQKTTVNNLTAYKATQIGMSETQEFFIQNKDLSFCNITFCNKELSSIENQFLKTFTFN